LLTIKDPPDATHIIVAHSHGGNVVLMALRDPPNLRERISGVACLATPFIAARDRNIGRHAWAILKKGSVIGLFLLGGLFIQSLFMWYFLKNKNDPTFDKLLLWNMVYAAACGLVVSVILLLRNRIREHASKLRRELASCPLERSQLLIIRSPADEASGALAFFQFLSEATVRFFLFGESLYVNVEALLKEPGKLLRIGINGFLAFVAFALLSWFILYFSDSLWLIIPAVAASEISFIVFFAGTILATYARLARWSPRRFSWLVSSVLTYNASFLALLAWLIIPVLSLLLVLPFGWQVALANLLLDVTAETTPPGSWEIHLIEPPTSEEIGAPVPPLMHKVYENPRVQRKLGEWIETLGSSAAKIT
jgi:hypothetical protein